MGCLTSSRLTWIASRLVTRTSYEDSSQRSGGSARGVRHIAPISCGITAIKPDGRLVAHTPVPLPHSGFRARIWPEFSMVSTLYTLSMGTYWVRTAERLTPWRSGGARSAGKVYRMFQRLTAR